MYECLNLADYVVKVWGEESCIIEAQRLEMGNVMIDDKTRVR